METRDTAERAAATVPPGVAIVRDPRRCGGDPILAGTRTAVHDVVSYNQIYGGDLSQVPEALPHLSLDQIHAALAWYSEHRQEINGILKRRREDYERGLAAQRTAR
jgi:uncharacterized protein (DUF433 family)